MSSSSLVTDGMWEWRKVGNYGFQLQFLGNWKTHCEKNQSQDSMYNWFPFTPQCIRQGHNSIFGLLKIQVCILRSLVHDYYDI